MDRPSKNAFFGSQRRIQQDLSSPFPKDPNETSPYIQQIGAHTYAVSWKPEVYDKPIQLSVTLPPPRIDMESLPTSREESSTDEFVQDVTAFEQLLPGMLQTMPGHFVAIRHGKIVDSDEDEFALAERVERAFRGHFVLIRPVCQNIYDDRLESPEAEI
jgi:hypothetical protein